jgi:uncharacterized protein (DUF2236 family)
VTIPNPIGPRLVDGHPVREAPHAPKPGSLVWRYFGDSRAALLGPQLLVLQVAHPVVGAGVLEHSNFQREPWRRLMRTFLSVSTVIYGGQDAASAEGARLRRLHRTIRGVDDQGRRYRALDPDAYSWVHATLVKGALDAHELFGRGLPAERIPEYYAQMRDVGRLLGLRDRDMPPDWQSFQTYYDDVVASRLEVNQTVWDVIDSVQHPKRPGRVPDALWRLYAHSSGRRNYHVLVGTLPPSYRAQLGLPWTARDERRLRRYARGVRVFMAMVPPPMRIATGRAAARWNVRSGYLHRIQETTAAGASVA